MDGEQAAATLTIGNRKGLHARAAAKFVKVVSAYPAVRVRVTRLLPDGSPAPDATVPGGSILGLMMLGAEIGTQLLVEADGERCLEALADLRALCEGRFGEKE